MATFLKKISTPFQLLLTANRCLGRSLALWALPPWPVVNVYTPTGKGGGGLWSCPSSTNGLLMRVCGGLNEDSPWRLLYLNTWSHVGRTVWEELGGVALLGENFEVSKDIPFSVSLMVVFRDRSPQLLLQHNACTPATMFLTVVVMDSLKLCLK